MSVARVADLSVASRGGLLGLLSTFTPQLRRGAWLPKSHPLYRDHLAVLRGLTDPPFSSVPDAALAGLIACAGPSHCIDAWRYFSRAVDALVRQDVRAAQHLAYYCELRAVVSLLAASGIGVFRDRHFVVHADGTCSQLILTARSEGTHDFVWRAFRQWTETEQALRDMTHIVAAFGYNLGEWLDAPQYGAAAQHYVSKLLLTLGFDLKRFNDKDTRNRASYAPSCVIGPELPPLRQIRTFVADVWTVLQPLNSVGNWRLDDFLVRTALKEQVGASNINASNRHRAIAAYCASKGLTVSRRQLTFLAGTSQEPSVLRLSRRNDPADAPANVLEMLSRALVLLRFATGASNALFRQAGVSQDAVDQWRESSGRKLGIWDASSIPFDYLDLWSDGYDATQDPDFVVMRGDTRATWLDRIDRVPSALTQFERVPFWSIGETT